MSITRVTVDGTDVPTAQVEYAFQLQAGASDVFAGPTASTCSFAFVNLAPAELGAWQVGATLRVYAYGSASPRFTGQVSDLTIQHDPTKPDQARVAGTATGPVARLGGRISGASSWPSEGAGTRAARIIFDASISADVNVDQSQTVVARDAKPDSALALLSALADSVGAAVYDNADGDVVFEAHRNRFNPYAAAPWARQFQAWNKSTGTWGQQTNAAIGLDQTYTPPAGAVVYAPVWQQSSGEVVNYAQVGYGTASPQATQVASDATSIDKFGQRAVQVSTELANAGDAVSRAAKIVTAQANPRWKVRSADMDVTQLTSAQRAALMAVRVGQRFAITNLPYPSPEKDTFGVVEGWTEVYAPGVHRIGFSLSDPLASGVTATWASLTAGRKWNQVSASLRWYDAISPTDV